MNVFIKRGDIALPLDLVRDENEIRTVALTSSTDLILDELVCEAYKGHKLIIDTKVQKYV